MKKKQNNKNNDVLDMSVREGNILESDESTLDKQINKVETKEKERLEKELNIDESDERTIYEKVKKITNWDEILEVLKEINPGLYAALKDSCGYLNEEVNIVFVDTDNKFFLDLVKSSLQARQTLKQAIFKILGKKYRIGPYKHEKNHSENYKSDCLSDIERLAKSNNVNFNIK